MDGRETGVDGCQIIVMIPNRKCPIVRDMQSIEAVEGGLEKLSLEDLDRVQARLHQLRGKKARRRKYRGLAIAVGIMIVAGFAIYSLRLFRWPLTVVYYGLQDAAAMDLGHNLPEADEMDVMSLYSLGSAPPGSLEEVQGYKIFQRKTITGV